MINQLAMMRIFSIFLIIIFATISVSAQDINGQWNGVLEVQGMKLRLSFNVNKTEFDINSTMDSPDQGVFGMQTTATSFENSILKISLSSAQIEYEGTLGNDDVIVGTFKQFGQAFPMNLSKAKIEKVVLLRPQEPKKPYPYLAEEIIFDNESSGIKLAGTLTIPTKDGIYPAVILISGSGPQNRDEELFGHKPFLVIADFLTRNGIAVLRYDDRGTAMSTGDFNAATSDDFATDVQSAIRYLKTRKEIDKSNIGLIGHSEGGIIAPIVASKTNDVAFIVLLAGTGLRGDQILLLQQKLIGKASGISDEMLQKNELQNKKAFEIVLNSTSTEQLRTELTTYLKQILMDDPNPLKPQGMSDEEFVQTQVDQIVNPWMQHFLKYDPVPTLMQVKCPVLAIIGEKDLQVPARENLEAIHTALTKGGNKNVTVKSLPNLNHLFQECETGAPFEYPKIEQTIAPIALNEILHWLQKQIKS